jgi:hypothetical protein
VRTKKPYFSDAVGLAKLQESLMLEKKSKN